MLLAWLQLALLMLCSQICSIEGKNLIRIQQTNGIHRNDAYQRLHQQIRSSIQRKNSNVPNEQQINEKNNQADIMTRWMEEYQATHSAAAILNDNQEQFCQRKFIVSTDYRMECKIKTSIHDEEPFELG